jgi:PAS domain-containing protein
MEDHSGLVLVLLLFGLGTCFAWMLPVQVKPRERSTKITADLNNLLQMAPFSIWIEDAEKVQWANAFCRESFSDPNSAFQGIREFKVVDKALNRSGDVLYNPKETRPNAHASFSIKQQKIGKKTLFYVQDATLLVQTENELKRFVQTLTSTFAHMPIGLAVFDKDRDLTLFNPALSHLLGLAPDWLARRPNMRSFLDRLRNDGAIPEPKDFTKLRHEFSDLESGAFTGKYEVDWALSSGAIYRVTGRPHPQGGAALLFEDVTRAAEVESQHRAELRQLYSALECLTDAVAIFDQAGELAYANDAFDDLWACSLSKTVAPITVIDATRIFQKLCEPTPVWGEFRNFVHDLNERSQWQAQAVLLTGRILNMTFSPIADGRVFCEFRLSESQKKQTRLVQSA